jgi:lipoprotein LpqH
MVCAAKPELLIAVAVATVVAGVAGARVNVSGPVVCSTTDGKFSIAIGTVDGLVMSFTDSVPGDSASATKTGDTYKIAGTASGVDSAGQQVHKPFEVNVTCP